MPVPNRDGNPALRGEFRAERPGIRLTLTPTQLGADSVEFDLALSIPDNPFLVGENAPIDRVAAHVVLNAR